MDFYVKRSAIEPELARLQSILERKSQIPIIENVHIFSESGHNLALTTTTLETTLSCTAVSDQIVTHGSMCLPARRMYELVKLLPEGMIHIEGDGTEHAKISAGRAKFRVPCASPDEFPDFPKLKDATPLQFSSNLIKALIGGVGFSIAPEEDVRYLLCGVKFESDMNGTKMVSGDGHRLSIAQAASNGELQIDDLDILIPKKALDNLVHLLEEDSPLKIALDDNHIFFESRGRVLSTRLLVGEFPAYGTVLQKAKEGSTDVIFNVSELSKAIKRAAFAADERSNAVLFDFSNTEVTLTAATAKAGEAIESLPIEFAGTPFKINLNSKFLLDYLNAVQSPVVNFGVKDSYSSVLLRSQHNKVGYACVVMPMELPD